MSTQTGTETNIEMRSNSPSAVASITHDLSTKTIVIIALLTLLLAVAATELGFTRARMKTLEDQYRSNTVATDLAKYNAEEVRVQAEVNKYLVAALHSAGGCKP